MSFDLPLVILELYASVSISFVCLCLMNRSRHAAEVRKDAVVVPRESFEDFKL